MPNITDYQANLEAANTVYKEEFGSIFGEVAAPGLWQALTEITPIDGEAMELVLEDDLSEVHEWFPGQTKKYSGNRAYSVRYSAQTFYVAKELARRRIQQDRSGTTGAALRRFLQRSSPMLDKIVFDKLFSNPTGYDGVSLISSSHPHGPSGNQSNSTNNDFSDAEFETGITHFKRLRKENGDYYELGATTLFVPPETSRRAREVVEADERLTTVDSSGDLHQSSNVVAATGVTNVWRGIVDVVEVQRMTSGDWLLADLSKPGIRPWILGFLRRPEPITAESMDDPERRNRDVHQWAVETDLAHGPGHWQVLYGRLQ